MNNPMMNMIANKMGQNPVFQLMNVMRNGGNPMALMQQMAKSNPQVNQVMQMMNGKNPQQLRTMAENMCKERGTTIEQMAQQLGIQLPDNK